MFQETLAKSRDEAPDLSDFTGLITIHSTAAAVDFHEKLRWFSGQVPKDLLSILGGSPANFLDVGTWPETLPFAARYCQDSHGH